MIKTKMIGGPQDGQIFEVREGVRELVFFLESVPPVYFSDAPAMEQLKIRQKVVPIKIGPSGRQYLDWYGGYVQ